MPGIGSFIRSLLRVHLTGGFAVTFGIWLQVSPQELRRANDLLVGDDQTYATFRVQGHVANSIPLWGVQVLGKEVVAQVRDASELPLIVQSSDPLVSRVINEEWASRGDPCRSLGVIRITLFIINFSVTDSVAAAILERTFEEGASGGRAGDRAGSNGSPGPRLPA